MNKTTTTDNKQQIEAARPLGDLQLLPISDDTRKWLAVLELSKKLRAAFVELEATDPRGIREARSEVLDPLDTVTSVLEDHYLHYSLMCDLDQITNPQPTNDYEAE